MSRRRRRLFTYAVVGGACTLAMFLALRGTDTRVAQIVAEGLMTMALATTCTYIGASAFDYTVGDRGAFSNRYPRDSFRRDYSDRGGFSSRAD